MTTSPCYLKEGRDTSRTLIHHRHPFTGLRFFISSVIVLLGLIMSHCNGLTRALHVQSAFISRNARRAAPLCRRLSMSDPSTDLDSSTSSPQRIATTATTSDNPVQTSSNKAPASLYRSEGLLAVIKPAGWTSSNTVAYVRAIVERDARMRGVQTVKPGSREARKFKNGVAKVGHGGTLDPLATGVLVIGVGAGTKLLQG
jgi:hypothetical protein